MIRMPRAQAAQRAAAANVATSLASLLSPARAEASRRNGAKSKGPRTAEGKARSAQNALKHGLRAETFVVVGDEDPQQFAALEAALSRELAPEGALQTLLVGRIVRAAWRLERAERIEAELFARHMDGPYGDGNLGLALIRDGNGPQAFKTLLRYRGAAQAEFSRMLRTLKALQAEAAQEASQEAAPAPRAAPTPVEAPECALAAPPNGPEVRGDAGESPVEAASTPISPVTAATSSATTTPAPRPAAPGDRAPASEPPSDPEDRNNPGETRFDAPRQAARAA
jgi:hypothetical protein